MDGDEWMIEVWSDDEEAFGGEDSKRGPLFNVVDGTKGDKEVGDGERTDRRTSGASAAVTLILRLNGEDFPAGTIVAKGALPYEGGDVQSGHLEIVGGTGRYAGLRGAVAVESINPKKYSVQSGG
jgi:hypothetical protein